MLLINYDLLIKEQELFLSLCCDDNNWTEFEDFDYEDYYNNEDCENSYDSLSYLNYGFIYDPAELADIVKDWGENHVMIEN